jgi:outer membrane protein assembly factor BamD
MAFGSVVKRLLAFAALVVTIGCATTTSRQVVPAGTQEPDKFLFDKGEAALNARKWITAREYYKQVVETYTQSPYRPDAKLAVGDTYLEEGGADNVVLAANEYREFLSYYPTNKRADYAQYKLGMTHFKQMRASERDQTETRDAIREFQTFLTRYGATSDLTPQVKQRLREAMDRLGKADYQVGLFYYRQKWYPGSIDRFSALLKSDPEFSSRGDVYFYLAESYVKLKGGREAQALPYYEKLVTEFPNNEHLQDAQKRIAELKAQQASNEKKS